MSFWAYIVEFWEDWLGISSVVNLISFNGTLINFSITTDTLIYCLSIGTIILTLSFAYFIIKWFINFVLGLCGGVR